MAAHLRWYVKKEGEVTGPFLGKVLSEHLILGRLQLSDEISLNQRIWRSIENYPELIPVELQGDMSTEEAQQRLKMAKLRLDERSSFDRRTGERVAADEVRSDSDRRSPEAIDEVRYRINKNDGLRQKRSNRPYYPYVIGAVIAFFFVLWFVLTYAPPYPQRGGINW